jgi:hypothetical protein
VSDTSEDPAGPEEVGTEPTNEQSLGAWAEPAGEPAWTEIELDAESAGQSGAGANKGPASQASGDTAPATEGGRLRRPSSLRSSLEVSGSVPRRRLTPPPFPKPGPASVSDPSAPEPRPAASNAPAAKAGPSSIEKFVSLVNERPEVGIGLAFAGGLVLATILKRLAR